MTAAKTPMCPKVCFVVATPMTVVSFLGGHLKIASKHYEVTVITDLTGVDSKSLNIPDVNFYHLQISRKIALWRDLVAFAQIFRLFRAERFTAVVSVTPKAGLLTAIAAFTTRVPTRIHWFTGQVWATKKNPYRFILKSADRVIAGLSTFLLADSRSQRDFLIAEKVIRGYTCEVLREGSISGVDEKRFAPDKVARRSVRTELGIPDSAMVVIFLGRITRDKGVFDLAEALAYLETESTVHSVWVGTDEEQLGPLLRDIMARSGHNVHFVGASEAPERFLAAADVLCLPSYREGFGTSVIEAAATGVPAVVSDIYGLVDAVVKGETGVVFPVGNARELSACLTLVIDYPRVREKLADAARTRALEYFRQEDLVAGFRDALAEQLRAKRVRF